MENTLSSYGLFVDTWDSIYQLSGKSDVIIFCLGSWLAAFVTYWVVSIPLLCMDLTHRPRFIYQYKMQMDKPIEVAKLKKLFKVVLLNQLFYAPLMMWMYYVSAMWRGCSISSSDLPSGERILYDLLGCLIFAEVTFYYSHRFIANYGSTGILDRLHGTDAMFRDSIAFKRHKILLGTTPMSKTYPDTKTFAVDKYNFNIFKK
uniref:Fatty acid hydroxylase domain-containing protein 2-like n=1 Tax=Saccoglossus kowalevskii TaxID=10224 RepID=A0ABM0M6F6_SACKO|nr:PREDICTED: fatty acid hydroxylase domain-containing protein 2-like [Saccoglossus kowalevskii]